MTECPHCHLPVDPGTEVSALYAGAVRPLHIECIAALERLTPWPPPGAPQEARSSTSDRDEASAAVRKAIDRVAPLFGVGQAEADRLHTEIME